MKNSSRTSDANQHDILFNYQSFEDDEGQRIRREVNSEESDGFQDDRQNKMEFESLERSKRAFHHKREISLPPGYSIFEVPKLSDDTPITIFLHLNISQILDFDELNEVNHLDIQLETLKVSFHLNLGNRS